MADPKRILIAEDQDDLRGILRIFLEKEGYSVLEARDGREALQTLSENRVDLVLSDVMMPMIDGYHLAREIHETFGENAPKIILITSRDTAKENPIALMAGADAFVQKPFKMDHIAKTIVEVLK